MIWKAPLVLSLVLCVLGNERPAISEQKVQRFYPGHHGDLSHYGSQKPEHQDVYAWAYPSYEFSYYVNDPHTHDHKGQHEIRDGDKVIGSYWLIQPDGLKRLVKYHADHKSGFHAEVKYFPYGHHRDEDDDGHKHVISTRGNLKLNDHKHDEDRNDNRKLIDHWKKIQYEGLYGLSRYGEGGHDDDKRPNRHYHDDKQDSHEEKHAGWNERRDKHHNDKHDDHDARHDGWNERRDEHKNDKHDDHDGRYGGWTENRNINKDDKHDGQDEKHGRWNDGKKDERKRKEGNRAWDLLWGSIRGREEQIREHKDVSQIHGHNNREHWNNGKLVEWNKGRARELRTYDDEHEDHDYTIHKNRGHEDHRNHHPNFKPVVPYGHRLY